MNGRHYYCGFDQAGRIGRLETWRWRHGREDFQFRIACPDAGRPHPWVRILFLRGEWLAQVFDPDSGKNGQFRDMGRARTALRAYRAVRHVVACPKGFGRAGQEASLEGRWSGGDEATALDENGLLRGE